jgi:serine/threonine-protein kinase PpkA
MWHRQYVVLGVLFVFVMALHAMAQGQTSRRPVTISAESTLPLRVLVRPLSHIYREKGSPEIVKENVPTFQAFYVYSRPEDNRGRNGAQGWYEVGSNDRGSVLGWMRAQDVIEWKQTMSLAYTHPEGRHPVLMFAYHDDLLELVKLPEWRRTERMQQLYATIESGEAIPANFPVLSVEPQKMIDINKEFYLLPITDFEIIKIDGYREGRLVKLAAATAFGPDVRDTSDIRNNSQYRQAAATNATTIAPQAIQELQADIVFVIDTTKSMQPYIDGVRDIIKDAVRRVSQNASPSLRFGLWGYRDDPSLTPAIRYDTKNYTPELQPVEAFESTVSGVEEASDSTVGYAEDVFSGVYDALTETRWRPDALRLLVLIGDAPGHGLGHRQNLRGQSAETLRTLANDKKAYIIAFYIKDPRYVRYHGLAAGQFRQLANNRGVREGPTYDGSLSTGELDAFRRHIRDTFEVFVKMVEQTKQRRVPSRDDLAKPHGTSEPPSPAQRLAADMGYAALVEWIGSKTRAKAPRDITAWAVDKDLIDPDIAAMEVRVLLNKRQLDSLKTVLSEVIAAGRRGLVGGEDFFTALQAVSATTVREPNDIKNARSLVDTGLIPEFLQGLPYKSRLMHMSNEEWEGLSNDQQDQFLRQLEAHIEYYATVHDTQEGWVQLNPHDDPADKMYPVPLSMLP